MKKLLSVLTLFTLFTYSAHASQARLLALGLDKLDNEGSYFIDDPRNIFLNPANAVDYSNMAFFEWGANGLALSSTDTTNGGEITFSQNISPKGQGGFLMDYGNYVVGAYFGHETNTSALLRTAATSNAAAYNVGAGGLQGLMLPSSDNQLDFFLAGKTANDLRWGVNLVYLNNEDEGALKQEDKSVALRLGAMTDVWQVQANVSLINEGKNTVNTTPFGALPVAEVTQEFDGKLGIHLGGSFRLNDTDTVYGYIKNFKWDQKDDYSDYATWAAPGLDRGASVGNEGTSEGELTILNLGYAHVHPMRNGGTVYLSAFVRKVDIELKLAETAEVSVLKLPVTLGFEAPATNWLTLRGSVIQNVYGTRDNKNYGAMNPFIQGLAQQNFGGEGKGSLDNSTEVRAGASLTFGDLVVDGLLGMSGNNMGDSLSMDNVSSRVAVTYSF